jgi:hypothetical protein
MDDETNKLLRQLIDLQKEQLELTRKNLLPLWTRICFSLLGLLLLMTLVAIGVGLTGFAVRQQNTPQRTRTGVTWVPMPENILEDDDLFGPSTDDPFAE